MTLLTKEFGFDSSHYLHNSDWDETQNYKMYGKCSGKFSNYKGHGHTYKMFVTLRGKPNKSGMMINFKDLKTLVNDEIIEKLDHRSLNGVDMFGGMPTTCEVMSKIIFYKLKPLLNTDDYILHSVKLYETPTSYCEFNENTHYNQEIE